MPNNPNPEEVAFAQKRMKLQAVLAPYFVERVQSPDFHPLQIGGDIATADGNRPRENTIEGQSLITSARFKTTDGKSHELALLIQHSDAWWPVVTVHSDQGGPTQSIAISGDIDEAIPGLKKLIDGAFDRARSS
ncbi:MAG: hypothetical protein JWL90_908 [Chthoniobacteraceae bacterium]|nr:hypothetical protein [Chthoniobacteraceae bacterium]